MSSNSSCLAPQIVWQHGPYSQRVPENLHVHFGRLRICLRGNVPNSFRGKVLRWAFKEVVLSLDSTRWMREADWRMHTCSIPKSLLLQEATGNGEIWGWIHFTERRHPVQIRCLWPSWTPQDLADLTGESMGDLRSTAWGQRVAKGRNSPVLNQEHRNNTDQSQFLPASCWRSSSRKTSLGGDCHPWRHHCRKNGVDRTQVLKDRSEKQVPGDGFESSLTASPCPLVTCKQQCGKDGAVTEASLLRAHSSCGPWVGRNNRQQDPEQPAREHRYRQTGCQPTNLATASTEQLREWLGLSATIMTSFSPGAF